MPPVAVAPPVAPVSPPDEPPEQAAQSSARTLARDKPSRKECFAIGTPWLLGWVPLLGALGCRHRQRVDSPLYAPQSDSWEGKTRLSFADFASALGDDSRETPRTLFRRPSWLPNRQPAR